MAWYAKPSGGYAISSNEGVANIAEFDTYFSAEGFTKEAIAGILGNVYAESALNPWRWQSDTVSLSGGYGLFQFTPASGYINLSGIPNHAPNMSTTQQTTGAQASDGAAQCYVMRHDTLSKWVMSCWRPYWYINQHPTERALRQHVLDTWGNGNRITLDQFSQINDIEAATFTFLACYEGPANLVLQPRVDNANTIYQYLTGGGSDDIALWGYALMKKRRRRGFFI